MKAALIALALLATPAAANTNLLVNGTFSQGYYLSTIDGHSNWVPVGWTPSAGWDYRADYNQAGFGLGFGNIVGDPLSMLSQTFSDVPGDTYQVSFNLNFHGQGMGFEALINQTEGYGVFSGADVLQDNQNAAIYWGNYYHIPTFANVITWDDHIYEPISFQFTGSGSDALTLLAFGNSNSVGMGPVTVFAVPEPATWALLLFGFAFFGIKGIWPRGIA